MRYFAIISMLALGACAQSKPQYTYVSPPISAEQREFNKAAFAGMHFPTPDRQSTDPSIVTFTWSNGNTSTMACIPVGMIVDCQ
ncbi:MAG: hypothetical protein JSR91_00270 [Proteobacteria bacterium]|nr:hypothetical protein [Pseudomonadota bacterium]